ncbi:isoquinoline 1-oxidoreductase beta subunit [Sphingomonas naasensis]|uniref:Xanthine dehydrogenase family protein molybdopterin-binding subunit n=1 Tax=Sphingomonas naasensis TaxID=1344951 RepID=A0A4S1WJI7_9SPHN|nr:xanthine dehydrogenase family protein molybdopterin-binding subunit [Sphingomonas naasensis]NIJ21792.1 isoquinoline 1-oxidoreductase beta subunit [Sphingomonas naasensis]TGX42505.1 xanthine dehydrogenase family protein molybdopterin-binding subunit [Sphingomonas naasensis]
MNAITPTRRNFLQSASLVLGMTLPLGKAASAAPAQSGLPFAPNAFVRVSPDNLVTVIIKHVEFGQGPATGLATLVADEMDADWSQIRVEMSPANDPLYKNLAFGTMGTGGSTAIGNSWLQMRSAGASAKAMLVEAAAKRWGVPAASIKVSKGVVSSGRRKASFGELAADAAQLKPPEKPVLKTPDQFTLIGRDTPRVDSVAKTNGTAMFTMDIQRPGMVHSAIAHPPAFGGTVKSVIDSAALAVPGVLAVKTIPHGVVVYARDSYAARKGVAALDVTWDLSKAEKRTTEELYAQFAEAAETPGKPVEKTGDTAAALRGAAKKLEAVYQFPYLAHAPMEPLDAVLEMNGDRLDVWLGSQFQVGELTAIAATLGVPFEKATLHQQFAGGSFGRRVTPAMEFAVEAALAFKAWGKGPVKHVWTRENDIRGGRYRPLAVHVVRGGLDPSGKIVAWDQVVAAQSFMKGTPMEGPELKNKGIDDALTEGIAESYKFANHYVGQHIMEAGVPTLWWRSVGNTHTAYAVETFVDQLLEMAGKDPVAGRLELMEDPRTRAVLARAAEIAGWGSKPPAGRARGVAAWKSFGSYVAQVAEVSKGADGLPKVHKVWVAVDCGIAVNPNVIRAQMESGIGYGLGHALYSEVELGEGGIVKQENFDSYRSLRIAEMPAVEVAILASDANPTGVGEPGLPPIAPAVANAWRKLTGKAVRRLPFAVGGRA